MFQVDLSVDGNIALVLCLCKAAKAPSTEDCCWHEMFVHLIHMTNMTSFCMQMGTHVHDNTQSTDSSLHANRNPYAWPLWFQCLQISQLFRILKIPEHAGCDGHGPCIHGTCELAQNGSYICNCDEGWYGIECDIPGKFLCLGCKYCIYALYLWGFEDTKHWRLLLAWDILCICWTWLCLHGIAVVGVAMHNNGVGPDLVTLSQLLVPKIHKTCRMWWSWALYSWHLWARWKWNLCLQLWRRVVWYRVRCSRYDSLSLLGILHWLLERLTIWRDHVLKIIVAVRYFVHLLYMIVSAWDRHCGSSYAWQRHWCWSCDFVTAISS